MRRIWFPFVMHKIRDKKKKEKYQGVYIVAGKELPRANNSRFFVRQSFPFGRLEFIKEFS